MYMYICYIYYILCIYIYIYIYMYISYNSCNLSNFKRSSSDQTLIKIKQGGMDGKIC